ncbi:MAG: 50S ribosomal protein L15 [Nitrospirae bacterium]|nr:50S ribosomal protein L15 [Nitrospirota bacterium]MBF0534279.1 50S ribosomal protein L15 [Nitrospirota bacterium]MBF0615740.1 50S ribosomal protein L15 [Nitrospirota bacterium]
MNINELSPAEGSTKSVKRIGRGTGSGRGKTSGKGHKGQKARAGAGKRMGFEGGQMPLQRRLPKRGFKNIPFKTEYGIINVDDINALEDLNEITPEALFEMGVIKKFHSGLKVLGRGELTRPVKVVANVFSKTAQEKIAQAGGQAVVL